MITRRACWPVLVLLTLLYAACSFAQQPIKYRQIDSHLHYVDFLQGTEGIQALLTAMDGCGVDESMIMGMPVVKQWDEQDPRQPTYYLDNDARCYWYSATDMLVARDVLSLPPAQQKRFHPFICGFNGADRNAVDHVRRMIQWYPGFWQGIGEVMTRHDDMTALTYGPTARMDSICFDPVFDLAAEYDLPVCVHSNVTSVHETDPIYLFELEGALRKHPKTKFIWAHAGASRRVVCPTLVPELRRVLKAYPNLYVDLSWVIFEDYMYKLDPQTQKRSLSPEWVQIVEEFPDRFMVGSDKVGKFSNYCDEMQKYYVFIDALKPETRVKFCRDNFLRLLPKQAATLK
jgi:predicted TIM-barrel fold metal-dependent hydrolase